MSGDKSDGVGKADSGGRRFVDLDALNLSDAGATMAKGLEGWAGASSVFQRIQDDLAKVGSASFAAPGGGMAELAAQLSKQEGLLAGLRMPDADFMARPAPVPDLHIPRNPTFETNERLERIEKQFGSMQEVAVQGAEIALSLQTYAADFLAKFEKAASDTEKSARKAVWVSLVAIVIAVATSLAPLAYDVWFKGPAEASSTAQATATLASLQQQLAELNEGLAKLQTGQAESTEAISTALEGVDEETVRVLREIRRLLESAPEPGLPIGDVESDGN